MASGLRTRLEPDDACCKCSTPQHQPNTKPQNLDTDASPPELVPGTTDLARPQLLMYYRCGMSRPAASRRGSGYCPLTWRAVKWVLGQHAGCRSLKENCRYQPKLNRTQCNRTRRTAWPML